MADPIVIERKKDGRLAPVEGDRRPLKQNETVTFSRATGLDVQDLVITFQGQSPFSEDTGQSFSYGVPKTVSRAFNGKPGGQNVYVYKCHKNGQPPSGESGGEIEIIPGG